MRRRGAQAGVVRVVLAGLLSLGGLTGAAWAQASSGTQRDTVALELHSPIGGWTYGSLNEDTDRPGYAYPANRIDRGGQRGRTLIQGRLSGLDPARRKPPTLVVNGNALPLYSDAEGRFARPWTFGPGSNGFEVRGAAGERLLRTQFYESNPGRPQARLRIILAWDDRQAELDLHVLSPDGQHAFWANPVLSRGGGGLDVDSVDGAGPEMFSSATPLPGLWQVWANYWGHFGNNGYHFDQATREDEIITARITVVNEENTSAERRETFTIPLRRIGDLVAVRSFQRGP